MSRSNEVPCFYAYNSNDNNGNDATEEFYDPSRYSRTGKASGKKDRFPSLISILDKGSRRRWGKNSRRSVDNATAALQPLRR